MKKAIIAVIMLFAAAALVGCAETYEIEPGEYSAENVAIADRQCDEFGIKIAAGEQPDAAVFEIKGEKYSLSLDGTDLNIEETAVIYYGKELRISCKIDGKQAFLYGKLHEDAELYLNVSALIDDKEQDIKLYKK